MRWDHYQLLVNQNAVSPRLSIARYFPSAGLVIHASYDRIFQTPSSDNILLSSSAQVISLNPSVLRLPVEPSHGNYFEVGGTKSFFGQLRFDANYFRRYVNNYADDDQILSTAVSFPIAFEKAVIYGAEAKVEIPKWGRFSGLASYSYIVGNSWLPVTGGLSPLVTRFVLRPFEFFAGRDDSAAAQVRRTQEHSPVRQHWEPRAGRVSPGTGRKNPGSGASFAPVRGGLSGDLTQGCAPWASIFRPPGSVRSMRFAACRFAGRAILPAAGFQAALSANAGHSGSNR